MTDHVTPQHYAICRFTCEPADLTSYLPHPLGSAVEYILRAPFKGQEADDLSKAAYWLRRFAYDDEWCEPCEKISSGSTAGTCRSISVPARPPCASKNTASTAFSDSKARTSR